MAEPKQISIAAGDVRGLTGVGFQRDALREALASLPGLEAVFIPAPGAYRYTSAGKLQLRNWITEEWWESESAVIPGTLGPFPGVEDNGTPYLSYPGDNNGNAILAPADWVMPDRVNYTLGILADLRPSDVDHGLIGSVTGTGQYVRFNTDADQLIQVGLGATPAAAWSDSPQLLALSSNGVNASLYKSGAVTTFASPWTIDPAAARLRLGKTSTSVGLDVGVKVYLWWIQSVDWNLAQNQAAGNVFAAATRDTVGVILP